jgi:hypothetical protein
LEGYMFTVMSLDPTRRRARPPCAFGSGSGDAEAGPARGLTPRQEPRRRIVDPRDWTYFAESSCASLVMLRPRSQHRRRLRSVSGSSSGPGATRSDPILCRRSDEAPTG